MGIFNLFGGGGNSRNRRGGFTENEREALREMRKQKSKLYRTMRTVVLIVFALVTTLLVLSIFTSELRQVWLYELIAVVYALCAGGAMSLPWITEFERDRKKEANGETVAPWRKIIVYVFWGLIGVAVILWAISVFVITDDLTEMINLSKQIIGDEEIVESTAKDAIDFSETWIMLRSSIIVTIQVAVGSVIATTILRYGKNYFVLRIIMYIAILYLDLWLSWFVGGTTVKGLTGEVYFAPIHSTILWVLAALMAVALGVSSGIFGQQAQRKELELFMKGDYEALTDGDVDLIDTQAKTNKNDDKKEAPAPAPAEKDPYEQLTKLKDLLDKGIITEEEYQAKRKDIIDKM